MNNPSKLIKFAETCSGVVRKKVREYSNKFSRKDYTQWQLLTLLCVMKRYRLKYREIVEILHLFAEFLGLKKIPHWTTLNKFFLRLKNYMLAILVELSAPSSRIEASIDASGYDRHYASKHYVRRCKMTFGDLKVTMIIDVHSLAVHRIHCTTTRLHDSQIILPLVNKTAASLLSLHGDAGYDAKPIRDSLRSLKIRPVIKHRIFWNIDKAHNAKMKDYGKRSMSETVNSMMKRKYGDYVSSKAWNNQFKEMTLKCLVHNIDLMLAFVRGFLRSYKFLSILKKRISVVPEAEFLKFRGKSEEICPDEKDITYFALALHLKCPIWSNEKRLRNQNHVNVYATHELIEMFKIK